MAAVRVRHAFAKRFNVRKDGRGAWRRYQRLDDLFGAGIELIVLRAAGVIL